MDNLLQTTKMLVGKSMATCQYPMTLPTETALMYSHGLQKVTHLAPQFTDAEIAANTQAELNATSRAYLASTDWYITRKAETGDAVPSEITTLRTAARDAIV